MKTLIRKELRENLKLAVLGLVAFTILAVGSYRSCAEIMEDAALGLRDAGGYWNRLQPLTTGNLVTLATLLCAVFGTVLGWMQIHSERHRDLWAFLVHRPTDRTVIYLGKVMAGLSLYLAAAGLPLACYIVWAVIPGHVAAPFQWEMVWPFFTSIVTGVGFYFAGMLTGLRQARWYASRAFGLGMAVLVGLTGTQSNWSFWLVLAVMLVGIAILATAVRGGFISHGLYQGQPALGKLALTASLLPGAIAIVLIAGGVLVKSLPDWFAFGGWSNYVMAKDGAIYKESHGGGQPPSIVDLDGKPFTDPQSGRRIPPSDFGPYACTTWSIYVDPENRRLKDSYPPTYFNFWREDQGTLWYYWARYGRLVGYNLTTRRFIGSLGPKGFAPDLPGVGDHFDTPAQQYNVPLSALTLGTATTLYKIDVQNRTAKPLFTAENDDSILTRVDILAYGGDWDKYTVVITKRYVHLLTPDGTVAWKVLYEPAYPEYTGMRICFLKEPGQFALWLDPSTVANRKAEWTLPIRVRWIDHDRGVLKTVDLPNLSGRPGPNRAEMLLALLMPAPFWTALYCQMDRDWSWTFPWKLVFISLVSAVVLWVPAGWWLGRRYNFTIGNQLGWAVFHLIFGLPGFLTFLSVQEWPAREPCPRCQKLRVVDREQCEHCGAEFTPPEKDGTEIFETVPAV
jgi:ABC-type transport system involved in multi-copper enzyme maturation permease subunit